MGQGTLSSRCSTPDSLVLVLLLVSPQSKAPPDVPACFLGVSPPVRSGFFGGAANPQAHDASWTFSAASACRTNLQALRELDSAGVSFLRQAAGDYRLLLGSPDPRSLGGLAEEASAADGLSGSLPRMSDDGGLGNAAAAPPSFAPFSCRAQYFAVR